VFSNTLTSIRKAIVLRHCNCNTNYSSRTNVARAIRLHLAIDVRNFRRFLETHYVGLHALQSHELSIRNTEMHFTKLHHSFSLTVGSVKTTEILTASTGVVFFVSSPHTSTDNVKASFLLALSVAFRFSSVAEAKFA